MQIVLMRALVARFFQLNAALFVFLAYILFGMQGAQATFELHYGLMRSVTGAPFSLAAVLLLWSLYALKCATFAFRVFDAEEHQFLIEIQAVNSGKQFRGLLLCQAVLLLLVLLYGGLTAYVGWRHGHFLSALIILLFLGGLVSGGAWLYRHRINHTAHESFLGKITGRLERLMPRHKPFGSYLLYEVMHERKLMIAGLKVLSLILLQAIPRLQTDSTGGEHIYFSWTFVISAHLLLPYFFVNFVERRLSFLRNLPIHPLRWLLLYVLTYAVILLPEGVYLALQEHQRLSYELIVALYLAGIGMLSLFTAMAYLPNMNAGRYGLWVIGQVLAGLVLLAAIKIWLFALLLYVAAFLIFMLRIYRYERPEES